MNKSSDKGGFTMTTKRIVLIIMCAMLVLTVVMAAIVIGKVSPLFGALVDSPDPTNPSEPSTQTEPTTETTTNPTTDPTTNTTTNPSMPPHEHVWSIREQQEATCEAAGYIIYECTCGETKMETKDVLEHSFGAGKLVAPNCTDTGYTERKCSRCGKIEHEDIQEALGHDLEFVKSVKMTCEVSGYDEYRCKRAGCTEVVHKNVVSATGHKWVKGQTHEPTCTEDGYTEYTCSNADCPVKTKQDDKVLALGHDFGDWKVITDPVAGKPGEETRECKRETCGLKETRETELKIPATNGQLKREDGKVWIYTINVAAKNAAGKEVIVYSYEVTDRSPFKDMTFTYDAETGLVIVFKVGADEVRTYTLLPGNYSITIDENGNKETEPANPSGPSEPTPSDPSEPAPSDPSEPAPSDPSESTPSEPSESTPSEPSESTPSEPSEGTE